MKMVNWKMFCGILPAVKKRGGGNFASRKWAIKEKQKGLLSDFVPSMALSIITTYEILMCYLPEMPSLFSL
jgi:hypothetical protein